LEPCRRRGHGRSLERRERQDKWRGGYERHGGCGYSGGWDGPRERKVKMRSADGWEVERKWKKGEYEEKVKCSPGRYGYR